MGPLPQAESKTCCGFGTYFIWRENMQSVCFNGNMLREHGEVQDLPTA